MGKPRTLLLLLLIVTSLTTLVRAQDKAPQSIEDYFLRWAKERMWEIDWQAITKDSENVIDRTNGYISISLGGEGTFVMVLFKRSNGNHLIAKSNYHLENYNDTEFFEYRNGKFVDVSKEVISHYSRRNLGQGDDESMAKLIYDLPREGKTVKVFMRIQSEPGLFNIKGAKLYDLVWRNDRFILKRTRKRITAVRKN